MKKTETSETAKKVEVNTAPAGENTASAAEQSAEAAPKKKKFTAVFRPQNAQQIRVKPKSSPKPARTKTAAAPKDSEKELKQGVQPDNHAAKPAEKAAPAARTEKPETDTAAKSTEQKTAAKPVAPVRPAAPVRHTAPTRPVGSIIRNGFL